MTIRLIAALSLALALAGCVSVAEQRALDEDRCRSYGFSPGSDGLAECLLQVDLDRSATRRAQLDSDFGPWRGPRVGFGYGFRRW